LEEAVRTGGIGGVIIVIWLLIGAVAAAQRGYFSSSNDNCAKAGTTAVTVLAGPLNYLGVNPKINCQVPQPSQ
jgi:membrane protein YdbS with pleckstrin-like domain